ncbi:MAG: fumarylacetoacetate hydrolase family protein [Clostridia bacterium]|nr:fumarylacetoacetate hydrolase family protein [Clostridia bacterium]
MKYVRVEIDGTKKYGCLDGDKVCFLDKAPYLGGKATGETADLASCRLLAPVEPTKVVAVGLNYLDHIEEMKDWVPEEPVIFMKPSSSVIGPEEKIVWPPRSATVSYEAELALVIGKNCRNVTKEEAKDYIFGYTCLNDVTARDLQPIDQQWTRAKGYDTFAPIGPVITDEIDPKNAPISSKLSGELRQNSNTDHMMRDVYELTSFISSVMTLYPGDVITTGTPSGVGIMKDGDVVEITVEGIGTLRNPFGK